jgi:hypothetical protein
MIFGEYVSTFYNIKKSVSSDNPWYTISKLLLNSLFGRFGMHPDKDTSTIIPLREYETMLKDSDIVVLEAIELDEFR